MDIKTCLEALLGRRQPEHILPKINTQNIQQSETAISMKSVAAASAALLSLASISSAQTYQQSKPFYLVVKGCKKFNGAAFVACHEGAAIEGLCVGGKPGDSNGVSTFQHNTTTGAIVAKQTAGEPGVLTFSLPVNGGNETGMLATQSTRKRCSILMLALQCPRECSSHTTQHRTLPFRCLSQPTNLRRLLSIQTTT